MASSTEAQNETPMTNGKHFMTSLLYQNPCSE
jgi:hypothetical protein